MSKNIAHAFGATGRGRLLNGLGAAALCPPPSRLRTTPVRTMLNAEFKLT